jgi:hypothetical protein
VSAPFPVTSDEDLADLGDTGDRDPFRWDVDQRKNRLRAEQLARAELAAESAAAIPPMFGGAEFLAQPDSEPVYRISDLWPSGGNVVLAAQFKAGKTTAVHNLVRSLCDGAPFLGRYHVTPPDGAVVVIDAEMPARSARRWLNEQMITRADRFRYQNIRGSASSFNILLPALRCVWADRIAASGAAVVVLDCLGPVLAALGLEENNGADVGRFLEAFQELLRDAAVPEAAVIHHMGHQAERARGASRLRDWPDAEWRLVRQDDDPASSRYFSAFGRDVDVSEARLEFDPQTRALRVAGGSRAAGKTQAAVLDLIEVVRADPGVNSRGLERALVDNGGHTQKAVRDGIQAALREGLIIRKDGPRRAQLHYPGPAAVQDQEDQ